MKRNPSRKGTKTSKRRKSRAALQKRAYKLWADLIKKDGLCVFAGQELGGKLHVCKGSLQAMHGFGRKAYPAVRLALWNGFSGCAAGHLYMTHHPQCWTAWMMSEWGQSVYWERYERARTVSKLDIGAIVKALQAASG